MARPTISLATARPLLKRAEDLGKQTGQTGIVQEVIRLRKVAADAGTEPFTAPPDAFSRMIREETKKWAEVIKAGNIKLQ